MSENIPLTNSFPKLLAIEIIKENIPQFEQDSNKLSVKR